MINMRSSNTLIKIFKTVVQISKQSFRQEFLALVRTIRNSVISIQTATLAKVALLFLLAITLRATAVKAQSSIYPIQLSIEPSVLEVAIKPGKTITKAFQVKNQGSSDVSLKFVLRDFTADNKTGQPHLLDTSSFPYAGLANSEFELGDEFLLPAGESTQAVLKLEVPENAVEKDWYFLLIAQSSSDDSFAGVTQAHPQGSVAANVLVRITQDNIIPLNWRLELNLPRFIDSLQSLSFEPLIHNDSTTYAIPEVNVVILDWRGQIISEQQGLAQRVLSDSSRYLSAAKPSKEDPRSMEGAPFELAPRFAFGPYRVRASVVNDIDGPVVVEQVVYALPFSLVGALLVLLIGAWVLKHSRVVFRSSE